jgi:iron(III) transport system permease protein
VSSARAAAQTGRRPPIALVIIASAVITSALLPLAYLVVRALDSTEEERSSVGVSRTVELVVSTGLLAIGVGAAALLVGVPLAWLVVRSDMPFRRVIGVLAALPLVIPSYVSALALLGAFGPRGMLQGALEPLGVDRVPDVYGYVGALVALTLSTYPYVFLLAAAALKAGDGTAEEAARSLGLGARAVFFRVTLPSLRPALAGASLLVVLYVLADFGAVSLMQYETLTRSIYLRYESLLDRGSAAILALVLVLLAGGVVWLEGRVRLRGAGFRQGQGSGRPARRAVLGRWRVPAVGYAFAVVGFFLVVPIAVLVWWTVDAARAGRPVGVEWEAVVATLEVSLLAAGVTVVAALPVAFLAWRYPSRFTKRLARLGFLPNAIPGIALALALVFFGARYGGVLYQSLTLLVVAYVVRFLPQALAPTQTALGGVDPRFEEAARGLGAGATRSLVQVVLPLIRSGLLAGFALVFLQTAKELPATLLLRPTGFDTLATEIWTDSLVGDYGSAAPSALVLILIASPLVYLVSASRAWELGSAG